MSTKKKAPQTPPAETSDTRLSRGRTRPGAIFPVAPAAASLPPSYAATLQQIKTHLRGARIRAIFAANPIVIEAYWQTGKIILARQQEAAWGAKVIDRLAADLQEEFPDMGGLTTRNLLSMKIFAREFPDSPIAKQPVSQLPWGQIIRLMQMVKDPAAREFYIRETLAHGWSRSILEIQIQHQLHLRAGKAQNNFALTMPPAMSASSISTSPPWTTSSATRMTNRPLVSCSAEKRTNSSPNMLCAASINPSPSPHGRLG